MYRGLLSLMLGGIGMIALGVRAIAQDVSNVVPDETLSLGERSLYAPSFGGSALDVVLGGTQRGTNLFHSFQAFNVASGRGVYFILPESSIKHVFARITGNRPSEIAGILGTRAVQGGALQPTSANLFLLNPNGIIFRDNAIIDVAGSLVATSADSILFQNQGQFSATNPERSTLLTIDPSAFLFQQALPKPIVVQSAPTFAKIDKSLVLLGGDLRFENSTLSGRDTALEFGGLAQAGTVPFQLQNGSIRLNFPAGVALADISLDRRSNILVEENLPSQIRLFGDQIRLSNGSTIAAFTEGSQPGSGIEVRASQLDLLGTSSILTQAISRGNAGDILIQVNTVNLKDISAILSGSVLAPGNAGNLIFQVSDTLRLAGQSTITTQTVGQALVAGQGGGGMIVIDTGNLEAENAQIASNSLLGAANAGSLTLRARDTITLDRSILSTASLSFGKAGDVTIVANALFLNNGSQIVTTSFSPTQFDVLTLLQRAASQISPFIGTPERQQEVVNLVSGYLKVSAEDAVRLGQTGSGNILIQVSDQVRLGGVSSDQQLPSQIFMDISGAGNAGSLKLETGQLRLLEGAKISAQTSGQGRGGDLTFRAETVDLAQGSSISTRSLESATGAAGDIRFWVDRQFVASDSSVSTTSTRSFGGAIEMNAESIRLNGNSDITTSVFSGIGNGGNITLTARSMIALGDSDLLAFAQDGQGGNITLNTRAFFGQNYRPSSAAPFENNNRVDINASGRVSGAIQIPDTTFIQNSLNQLSQTPIDTQTLLANSCIVRNSVTGSFYITGSSGIPIRPGDLPLSPYPVGAVQPVHSAQTWKRGEPIIEPQAAYHLPDGKIILSRECPASESSQ